MKKWLCIAAMAIRIFGICSNASAAIWFAQEHQLHRDPLCDHMDFARTPDVVAFASAEDVYAQGDFLICSYCNVPIPDSEGTAWTDILYYYPVDGKQLHTDPNCAAESKAHLPLLGAVHREAADWSHCNACPVCAPDYAFWQSDLDIGNATLDEKAKMLPGVWTLPSAEAISAEEAQRIARQYIGKPDSPLNRFSPERDMTYVFHYDTGTIWSDIRETYRIIVIDSEQVPVAMIYVDAVSGEVYTAIAADM